MSPTGGGGGGRRDRHAGGAGRLLHPRSRDAGLHRRHGKTATRRSGARGRNDRWYTLRRCTTGILNRRRTPPRPMRPIRAPAAPTATTRWRAPAAASRMGRGLRLRLLVAPVKRHVHDHAYDRQRHEGHHVSGLAHRRVVDLDVPSVSATSGRSPMAALRRQHQPRRHRLLRHLRNQPDPDDDLAAVSPSPGANWVSASSACRGTISIAAAVQHALRHHASTPGVRYLDRRHRRSTLAAARGPAFRSSTATAATSA